ncbi:hypothetical protein CH251_03610 [Rhodococcus sp. 06-462-5]|nr:hypothetical protein CH251_03610 [Rhodococcus sp. 06-462-5]OZE61215.1 hypothetical protein CH270_21660 [Rhodococcus sp. 02-925g]
MRTRRKGCAVNEVDTVRHLDESAHDSESRTSDVRVAVTADALAVEPIIDWATIPRCGAVVTFTGVVREYSKDSTGLRADGVVAIDYQSYESVARARLFEIAEAAQQRWPDIGRIALLHRTGSVAVGEASVLVCVSAGHRVDAFLAAQFCIDIVKASVPVWKLEQRETAQSWVETGVQIESVEQAASQWSPVTCGAAS